MSVIKTIEKLITLMAAKSHMHNILCQHSKSYSMTMPTSKTKMPAPKPQKIPNSPTVSVLTDPLNVQVKTITPTDVIAAVNGEWFTHEDRPFNDLMGLYDIVRGLSNHQLIVHAQRTQNPEHNGMVRVTRHKHRKTGELPFYEDRPAPTLTIDLDDTPVPAGCSWERPTEMAGAVWMLLQQQNPILKDVGCVWRTSGSAAVTGKEHLAKFHFTVILGKPLMWHDREAALLKIRGADKAMSRVVQKHYLAGRVCAGIDDPLAGLETTGVFDGGPMWHPVTPAPTENPYEIDVQISDKTTDFGRDKLRQIASVVSNAAPGTGHDTVLRMGFLIGGYVGGGEISPDDAFNHMKQACAGYANGKSSGYQHTMVDAITAGIDKPRSNVSDWAKDLLQTEFDVAALAEYANTLEDDQREKLLDMVEDLCTSKVAKQFIKALTGVENREKIEKSKERFSQYLQPNGELSSFVMVLDNGKSPPAAVAVNIEDNTEWERNKLRDRLSHLADITVAGKSGTKDVKVGDYFWDCPDVRRFDGITYSPGQSQEIARGEKLFLNSYIAEHAEPVQYNPNADVSPFLYLLRVNFPDRIDQKIILSFLAHTVQRPAEKLGWAVVLQGAQGCGKGSLVKDPLKYCVGHRNLSVPNQHNLSSEYNSYMYRKTAVVVDEIGQHGRKELVNLAEDLKEPMTENYISYRLMRTDPFMDANYCNFAFLTNHQDSMFAHDPQERRYVQLISDLQTKDQVAAAFDPSLWNTYESIKAAVGEGSTWFAYYKKWWNTVGAERVHAYLDNQAVAVVGRAPQSTTTLQAQDQSLSELGKLVKGQIESQEEGFRGGFVSSNAIKQIALDNGLPPNAVQSAKYFMPKLGFGSCSQVRNAAQDEIRFLDVGPTKRPQIYSSDNVERSPAELLAAYEAAQGSPSVSCENVYQLPKSLNTGPHTQETTNRPLSGQ